MNILISGIGGLGGIFAGELIRAGYNPTLLTNNANITQAINTNGIRFSTPDEDNITVQATAFTHANELPTDARFDSIWLVMKANSVVEATRTLRHYLKADGYMVAFQNGLVEDAILEELDSPAQLVTASVAFGGNMEAAGVYRRTTQGTIFIGELDGKRTERIQALQQIVGHILKTEVSDNIIGLLWGKLCWNAAVSGLCAVAGGTFGDMTAHELGRALLIQSYTETIETGWSHGVDIVPVVVGPTLALHLPANPDVATIQQRHDVLIHDLTKKYADVKPSSLQSLERGRPTETEFLNGYVVKKAAKTGIPVPLNTALTRMIAEIEAKQRTITTDNLTELVDTLPDYLKPKQDS